MSADMAPPPPSDDPVERYAVELAAALRGPAGARERLVAEVRDGLAETVAAYEAAGVPAERAVREAVAEFGSVAEVAASCQRELTVAQARHTARALALTGPFLVACWWLVRGTGDGQGGVSGFAHQVAVQLSSAAAVAVVLAALALAATGAWGRWLPVAAERLPAAVAWTGTAASVAMAVTTLTLATAAFLAEQWPLTVLAGALAAASHAVVAGSARVCRECARLSSREPAVA
ncbi:permease prefix domain 1-containing protein [Streptomyces albidoflavus]|uniref:permease prefix domain 1-containing protein n=1 Tax=Streptomyces albidoflavus TaxID=1886 RepID=UPI001C46215D|nr:permease prefix domain 1-containing protein [Streptomyces albidoflavus]MBV7649526.1 permease prefix domain 1-containing protein [Streptomyces albidoflavus]MBV7710991.1 permease prefix domain 1-containing protein [Streptomyces albidoflavus]